MDATPPLAYAAKLRIADHRSGETWGGKFGVVMLEDGVTVAPTAEGTRFVVTDRRGDILLNWTIGDGLTYELADPVSPAGDDNPMQLKVHGPDDPGPLSLVEGEHAFYLIVTRATGEVFAEITGPWRVHPPVPTPA